MTEANNIVITETPTVWIVAINRPRRRNALDDATIDQLSAALKEAEQTPGVAGLVLAGEGEKAFCAGSDLKALAEMNNRQQLEHVEAGQKLMAAIEQSPLLTVSAVSGFALGGGFELALASDLIVTSLDSTFGLPEAQNGMISAWGGTFRLARAIGLAKARAIILGGIQLDGEEAVRAGIAISAVDPDSVVNEAVDLILRITENSSVDSIAASKKLLLHGLHLDTAAASHQELLAESMLSHSDNYGQRKN